MRCCYTIEQVSFSVIQVILSQFHLSIVMELDDDRTAQRARIDDLTTDPDTLSAKNVEVHMPIVVLSNEVRPTTDVAESTLIRLEAPNFLHSDPIYPSQGVPLHIEEYFYKN